MSSSNHPFSGAMLVSGRVSPTPPSFSCQHKKKNSQWSQWSPGPVACTNVSTGCLNCGDGLNGSSAYMQQLPARKAWGRSPEVTVCQGIGPASWVSSQQQVTYRRLFFKQPVGWTVFHQASPQTLNALKKWAARDQTFCWDPNKNTQLAKYVVMPGPF